jgi:hypothetical protein
MLRASGGQVLFELSKKKMEQAKLGTKSHRMRGKIVGKNPDTTGDIIHKLQG